MRWRETGETFGRLNVMREGDQLSVSVVVFEIFNFVYFY